MQQAENSPVLGEVAELTDEVRSEIAKRLTEGTGSIDEVVVQLLAGVGKELVLARDAFITADQVFLQTKGLYNFSNKSSPEAMEACLKGLERDFNRGIVVVDHHSEQESFRKQLERDPSAGTCWELIRKRLLANNSRLLKKASTMQKKGELIGIFESGNLCIIDRGGEHGGREPVLFGFDACGKLITITTDTPSRNEVIRYIAQKGKFANYHEILKAVRDQGFYTHPFLEAFKFVFKHGIKGIAAAVKAVSQAPFVAPELDFHDAEKIYNSNCMNRKAVLNEPKVCHYLCKTNVIETDYDHPNQTEYTNPRTRDPHCGAIRILIG